MGRGNAMSAQTARPGAPERAEDTDAVDVFGAEIPSAIAAENNRDLGEAKGERMGEEGVLGGIVVKCPTCVIDWSIRSLGECALWLSGGTPRKSRPEYWGGSIPWISAKSLNSFFIEDSEDRVTALGVENGTRLVPKDTVLFIVRGMSLKTEFRMGITIRPVTFNQDLKALVAQEGVDSKFLAYAIKSMTPTILGLVDEAGHGTGRLATDLLQALQVPLPPIDEQRRIAAVLGALDDKIELNRKMNRTLEEMAQAIFKSWFIDFDGHDDLVDSEIGPVPRGWGVGSLDEIADFLNGAACQKYPAIDGAPWLPVIKIRELNQGVTAQTDRATATIPDKWHVSDGDVLFSWSGSLVVKVWTGGPGALNQHLFKVTSEAYPRWFYLSWVQHHLAEFQRIAADKATTMGHIKRHHLTDAKCAMPPADVLAKVGALLEPVVNRQVANELESRTLAALRDTLLPKLISGEIRVPETEEAVGAASSPLSQYTAGEAVHP